MGTAQRICSQFLHLMKTVLHQLIRDCYARSRMIHMLAEALHLKEGTIQQQAFFPVRLYASDTKGGLPYIHSFPIINKLGPQGIQTVSYTHLDVYKRQHLFRYVFILGFPVCPGCYFIIYSTKKEINMNEKVILISIDGMRPDGAVGCGHPFVQELMEKSTYTLQGGSVLPPVTLPCHTSMFYGVPPERHGILTNTYTPVSYTHLAPAYAPG